MAKLFNLARMTTATAGTGTLTLGTAVAGFLSFVAAGIADGDTVTYAIKDGANSEIGRGLYTSSGTTLTRSVLKSTNSNNPISLSGSAEVFITPAAEDFTDPTALASINTGPLAGFRNRLLNGCMRINQRAASSNADGSYCLDRWYVLTQTSTIAASVLTNVENTTPYMMRLTQSQASAQRFGVAQVIENINCVDMRGQAVTLSARVRISASTTLRYAIIEWTGTADTVTKDWVLDWTNATFTAGQFFTTTSTTIAATGSTALTANTLATVSLSGTISSSATNIAVMFWTDSTQAQNVTLDLGKVQFEHGSAASVFERRPYATELANCHRYYWQLGTGAALYEAMMQGQNSSTTDTSCMLYLPTQMRVAPTNSVTANGDFSVFAAGTDHTVTSFGNATAATVSRVDLDFITSSLTANQPCIIRSNNTTAARIRMSAEL